jgi:hypothetical protein
VLILRLTLVGIETISHLRENGRMTIMFCAFEGAPQIARLFGTGTFHEYDSPEYNTFIPMERRSPGSRAVIVLDIHKVGTSCGFSIPFYTFKDNRMVLHNMAAKKENEDIQAASCSPGENDSDIAYPERGLKHYWKNHNVESIDGLPALSEAFNSPKVFNVWTPEKKPTSGTTLESSGQKSSIPDFFDTRLLTGVAIGAAATAAASFALIRLNAH